mgnify:CR=1 FL=1
MKEKFLQYIADSGKFGSDPDNLRFTETFSIFTSILPEIEKFKKEYEPHVSLEEIIQYYFEDMGGSKFQKISQTLAEKYMIENNLEYHKNIDNLLDIIQENVKYEPMISSCLSC